MGIFKKLPRWFECTAGRSGLRTTGLERLQCNRKWGPAVRRSKANKEARLVERKVCFILDASNRRGGRTSVQRATPHHWRSVGKSFYRWREGLHVETAQSALTVILKLVIGGLTSVILILLSTINLQFQGWFVPISLRPILIIVAAYVMATVWSSCS